MGRSNQSLALDIISLKENVGGCQISGTNRQRDMEALKESLQTVCAVHALCAEAFCYLLWEYS